MICPSCESFATDNWLCPYCQLCWNCCRCVWSPIDGEPDTELHSPTNVTNLERQQNRPAEPRGPIKVGWGLPAGK
jgi:hypothetical protein